MFLRTEQSRQQVLFGWWLLQTQLDLKTSLTEQTFPLCFSLDTQELQASLCMTDEANRDGRAVVPGPTKP